jgi:hypothetical protein
LDSKLVAVYAVQLVLVQLAVSKSVQVFHRAFALERMAVHMVQWVLAVVALVALGWVVMDWTKPEVAWFDLHLPVQPANISLLHYVPVR